jgi:integral membrane protein
VGVTWLSLRLVKFGALVLLGAGLPGALGGDDRRERLRWAYGWFLPAFCAVWLAGYGLLKVTGRSFEPWVLAGMGYGLAALHLVLRVAHVASPPPVLSALAVGLLGATVSDMVLRPTSPLEHVAAAASGAVTAVLAMARLRPLADPHEPGQEAERWIHLVGRAEGASFVALLVVSVGRRVLAVELGHFPAILGFAHGALLLVWWNVVWVGGGALGWSAGRIAWGLVSGLLPLGPLLFERFPGPRADGIVRG